MAVSNGVKRGNLESVVRECFLEEVTREQRPTEPEKELAT